MRITGFLPVSMVVAALLSGCGGGSARAPREPARPDLEPRIDVVVGHTTVVAVPRGASIDLRGPLSARMDDGRKVEVRAHWMFVRPDARPARWIPESGTWGSAPAMRDPPPPGARLVLSFACPPDAIGQGLWLNAERLALNWIPNSSMLAREHPRMSWRPILSDSQRADTELVRLIEPESRNPAGRWRFRLLTEGLRPPPMTSDGELLDAGYAFDDPIVEAWARQTEERWRAALARLWAANADAAERLRNRIAAVARFPGRAGAPAWPAISAELDELVDDLLDPRLNARQLAARADLWLERQRPAVAWTINDAHGEQAGTGAQIALFGLANLTERSTLGWVTFPGALSSPTFVKLTAYAVEMHETPGPRPELLTITPATPTAHVGSWETPLLVVAQRIAAAPPGIPLGPMKPDWTMEAWLQSDERALPPLDPALDAAAWLFKREDGRWLLHVECRSPEGAGELDAVRIWLGPMGSPVACITVAADGQAWDSRLDPPDLPDPANVRSTGRWAFEVELPRYAAEARGVLRIGLERLRDGQRIGAWPRAMLPWQDEPARIAIDLTAWDGR